MPPKVGDCRVAIRVDASARIGTGHFMRCLSLAEELLRRGATVHFVSRQLPEYLQTMLADRQFGFARIGSALDTGVSSGLAHAEWLGTTQQLDAEQTREALSGRSWDWMIVDHYALDAVWEKILRPLVKKIAVIDDIADRVHDCDLLLDQNFYQDASERYTELVSGNCQLLLGPAYALLRSEFSLLRQQTKLRSKGVRHILVFFGGVDASNMTAFAIKSLAFAALQEVQVDVVIGAHHPRINEVGLLCAAHGYSCSVQTERMAEMMLQADLAIGAAGSASWERCCLGLPTLLFSLADNQLGIAQSIEELGAGKYVGRVGDFNEQQFAANLKSICTNKQLVFDMSSRAYAVTDGRGVFRVCSQLGLKNEDIHSLH